MSAAAAAAPKRRPPRLGEAGHQVELQVMTNVINHYQEGLEVHMSNRVNRLSLRPPTNAKKRIKKKGNKEILIKK